MLVEVFKKDIVEGDTQNCETCAVARALCRLPFPDGANHVKVDSTNILYICRTPVEYRGQVVKMVKLPRVVQRYIRRFDNNKNSVCPTVFNIDL